MLCGEHFGNAVFSSRERQMCTVQYDPVPSGVKVRQAPKCIVPPNVSRLFVLASPGPFLTAQ